MASKTLNQFTPSTNPPLDSDYIVGYTLPIYDGERRWTVTQLKQALSNTSGNVTPTLVPSGKDLYEPTVPVAEMGFIKFLAKQAPSRFSGAAVTTTNRVICWGLVSGNNGSNGGVLAPTPVTGNNIEPMQYLRVPFYSSWTADNGADGVDYLDENPTVTITDLYWTTRVGLALLSDGTVWVAGYNNGGIGLGTGPAAAAARPTCGFVKVNFNGMTAGAKIKKIQCGSDNSTSVGNNDTVFAALDTTNTLWMWGVTQDGVFGTDSGTVTINFPTKIGKRKITIDESGTTTQSDFDFESKVLDFSITGCESAGTAIGIVLTTGELFFGGDNSNHQRGVGTLPNGSARIMNIWNRAYKNVGGAKTAVSDAVSVERSIYTGRTNHYYVDSSKKLWACGYNAHGQLGDGGTVNTYAAKGYFTQVLLPANYEALVTEPSVFSCSYHFPVIYALCKHTTTGKNALISWGHNGGVGYCGVDSTATNISTPTICKYRAAGGNKAELIDIQKVFISDQTGNGTSNYGAVGAVDSNGYAYSAGYGNYNDPPLYNNNNRQFFIRLPMKNVKEMTLGSRADIVTHSWTMILQNSGVLWGMGDVNYKLFGSADVVKYPIRLL
jgi:hypothetical protein